MADDEAQSVDEEQEVEEEEDGIEQLSHEFRGPVTVIRQEEATESLRFAVDSDGNQFIISRFIYEDDEQPTEKVEFARDAVLYGLAVTALLLNGMQDDMTEEQKTALRQHQSDAERAAGLRREQRRA